MEVRPGRHGEAGSVGWGREPSAGVGTGPGPLLCISALPPQRWLSEKPHFASKLIHGPGSLVLPEQLSVNNYSL